MFRKKRFWLFLCVFSFGLLGIIILFFPPNLRISLAGISLPIFPAFFVLVFAALFSMGTLVLRNIVHGILLGILVVAYLLMRLNGLTHPFFLLLLLGIFLALELLFVGSKKKELKLKRQD